MNSRGIRQPATGTLSPGSSRLEEGKKETDQEIGKAGGQEKKKKLEKSCRFFHFGDEDKDSLAHRISED